VELLAIPVDFASGLSLFFGSVFKEALTSYMLDSFQSQIFSNGKFIYCEIGQSIGIFRVFISGSRGRLIQRKEGVYTTCAKMMHNTRQNTQKNATWKEYPASAQSPAFRPTKLWIRDSSRAEIPLGATKRNCPTRFAREDRNGRSPLVEGEFWRSGDPGRSPDGYRRERFKKW
jgi:hypothetical protein